MYIMNSNFIPNTTFWFYSETAFQHSRNCGSSFLSNLDFWVLQCELYSGWDHPLHQHLHFSSGNVEGRRFEQETALHFSPAHSPSRHLWCDAVHSTEQKAFWVLLSKERIANNKKKNYLLRGSGKDTLLWMTFHWE